MYNKLGEAIGYTILNLPLGNGTDAIIKSICSNLGISGGKIWFIYLIKHRG